MSATRTISLVEQIAEIGREIAFRERVYPRLVMDGRMTEDRAAKHMRAMEAVLTTLKRLQAGEPRI